MPKVTVRDYEPFDVAIRRLKRQLEKAAILTMLKRKENYEKPTAERKRKKNAAVKRHQKKLAKEAATRRIRIQESVKVSAEVLAKAATGNATQESA